VLVEPGDIDAFADALAEYALDPELLHRHGEAGLAVAKTMDWDEINASVLRVYERVIQRRETNHADDRANGYLTLSIRCAASSRIAAIREADLRRARRGRFDGLAPS
jgi:hypothetical protein